MSDLHHVCVGDGDGDYNDGDICPSCKTKFSAPHQELKPGFIADTVDPITKLTIPAVVGKVNGL